MARLELHGVTKRFGETTAVNGLSLSVEDGSFCALLGPSGCGKSTLLRMIAGLEEVNEGRILIDGTDVTHLHPADRGTAMVFQTYALYPHLTVAHNIGFPLSVAGASRAEIDRRVGDVARLLKLEELLHRKPGQLSGGQRQRVAIGRALVRDPKIFLFDEPLSNLDALLRVQMRLELARLHQQVRTTKIYVTHDQVEAMTLADKIVVMNKGEIAQVGTPLELYNAPADRFVASFIGSPAMNFFACTSGAGGALMLKNGTAIEAPAGKQVPSVLGIRPEHLAVCPPDDRRRICKGQVNLIERLGSQSFAFVESDAGDVTVQIDSSSPITIGDLVGVVAREEHLHFF
jgi:multiple sugar transport system ATP-binding protein